MVVRPPLQLDPVQHHHRQAYVVEPAGHQLAKCRACALDERPRDRRLRRRARTLLELGADRLLRAPVAAGRDAGEHPLQHDLGQRIAVGEVGVGPKRQLAVAIGAAGARPLDRHPAPAERHLARLVAVAHRDPIGILPAPRAYDLDDFLFHQLGQHAEPDADRQRQQSLPRSSNQLTQRLLHARGQHSLLSVLSGHGLRERYGCLLHGGSSFDLRRIASNAPKRNGRGRRDRRQVLRATGQPPQRRGVL